jgi:hypothetical protein
MSPRQTAIKNKDMFYEGRPCKKGHIKRSTKWRTCIECESARWGKTSEYTKEKKRARAKVYNSTPAAKKRHTEWKMERYHSNPLYRLKDIRRRQLLQFIKSVGGTKTGRTEELLGYTAEELKIHLESLFQEGMTWNNQGKWHIDHIIPQSHFTSIDQIKECFALNNLKPEWGDWNMSKGNRFIGSSEEYPMTGKVIKN